MNDLISRAALLKECAECQKTDPLFEKRGWASHFINDAGEPSTEWYCVEDMIENATAVDAIPVEWLFDWRDRALKEGMNPELVEWIEYILQIWSREKEQEAHGT